MTRRRFCNGVAIRGPREDDAALSPMDGEVGSTPSCACEVHWPSCDMFDASSYASGDEVPEVCAAVVIFTTTMGFRRSWYNFPGSRVAVEIQQRQKGCAFAIKLEDYVIVCCVETVRGLRPPINSDFSKGASFKPRGRPQSSLLPLSPKDYNRHEGRIGECHRGRRQ